ncbi:MAG: glutathione S-transferase family protein [Alphaproteobacteria bacterium]
MAIIIPTNKAVEDLKGLHLYHGDISNCSMRVRMTLIEKGLDWTSHHIDLKKKENISDEYFGINPNGLVPTLVDDGIVHIESNEIIDYLDNKYPGTPLRVTGREEEMLEWLRLAGSIHLPAVKPYVYATKIAPKLQKTAAEQAKYDDLQKNRDLKEFHKKHAAGSQFSKEDIDKAIKTLDDCFTKLDRALEGNPWILGDQFSLADISWIPLYHVLVGCGYPFQKHQNILRWADSLNDRESFKEGVLKWCPDFSKV